MNGKEAKQHRADVSGLAAKGQEPIWDSNLEYYLTDYNNKLRKNYDMEEELYHRADTRYD